MWRLRRVRLCVSKLRLILRYHEIFSPDGIEKSEGMQAFTDLAISFKENECPADEHYNSRERVGSRGDFYALYNYEYSSPASSRVKGDFQVFLSYSVYYPGEIVYLYDTVLGEPVEIISLVGTPSPFISYFDCINHQVDASQAVRIFHNSLGRH